MGGGFTVGGGGTEGSFLGDCGRRQLTKEERRKVRSAFVLSVFRRRMGIIWLIEATAAVAFLLFAIFTPSDMSQMQHWQVIVMIVLASIWAMSFGYMRAVGRVRNWFGEKVEEYCDGYDT